ncbi:glycosyltransferase family 4 protein [Chryseobacterium sp. Bi04]|uniref:glycosyltransferase family 4 protein n=1 Tax=Chryseobacterium sp. Bi04 TaxID=2822345 RepID=UPI001D4F499C|nr:glycosyltransferase family 4 protein [Chryseobacterium sp. Bi04]CAH0274633.1 hypothetical protein SRABI04_03868 [Chryseobacterium sp. Bi04]
MKIIIPIYAYGKAGGFRVLSQLANHFIKDGHKVVFLSHKSSDIPYYPTKAEVLYYDNNGSLSSTNQMEYNTPVLGIFSLRRILKNVLDNITCDIILANHSLTAQPVAKCINSAKKFYYIQAYEPDFFNPLTLKNRVLQYVSKRSYGLGLNMIVNSKMYFDFKEIKAEKYVPPGLDLNIFREIKNKKSEKLVIGTIGRKEKHKGTGYIIEAFKNLKNKYNLDIELNVAFGTKDLENIEGIITSQPDGDENLANFYNSLDVYICAQTIQLDAIHYPILESMACKVPVITTGYYPSSNSNAFLIPIEDVNAIEEMILSFLEYSKEDIIKKTEIAYQDIKQFDWTNVSRQMLSYFEN